MSPSPIDALAAEFLEAISSADPFSASVFGLPGYDDQVPDLSADGEAAAADRLLALAGRAEAIPADTLSEDDQITRDVLIHTAHSTASPLTDRHAEFALAGHTSPITAVFTALANTAVKTPQQEQDYLTRLRRSAGYLAQVGERALAGAASGQVPTQRGLTQAIDQYTGYLSTSPDDDSIVRTVRGTRIEGEARALVVDSVRPAIAALLETLAGPVRDKARSDDDSGVLHLPDGPALYARAVAAHTSTDRDPEEIHQLGLDICAQLRDEYAALGKKVFGTGDFDTIVDRLRNDPGLRYETDDQILADTRGLLARAESVVGDWFGRVYRTPCTVTPIDEVLAPTAVPGQYVPPAGDGSRPGQFQVNTYRPETRTRYEYETLSFHESVPGHHLQFALSQELTHLPEFRRYLYLPAFGEGWGLYSERLADEMGLYSGDLARFGMVSFDSWRACRLVVDTGMHHRGWTRQQAIDFMLANSALTPGTIINEVDRYISWPGQALGYMIGRLEIEGARKRATDRLGAAFDIRAFHDVLHSQGALPMTVLNSVVDRWIERTAS
ncbi:uncharacterized protein (DUF885 family) [Amycolatopsis sulphurea]|uniref:Uncharacterized protein (DUF885 family) n=1 Tax=Amycolatopsis sulphurea TaxID=76022 RepID=A0A2A9G3Y7_9PSEU|nr:DUF885 domain-containing protein [Amycolatopsis sulphurea]PFG57582.1 uncharacterized protein (DUF885 family) [Amycolatopsis sulphurea]